MAFNQPLPLSNVNSRAILVFAKAPVLGTVKTRMLPVLSAQDALSLHRDLVEYLLEKLLKANIAKVELWLSEPFPGCFSDVNVKQFTQLGGSLGQRLNHALSSALERYQSVVIVGGDCPFIDADYLEKAFNALNEGYQSVLGPADDGGYVLIGSRQSDARLFEKIDWGSGRVLVQTREQLKAMQWRWQELDGLSDIDRPEDLSLLGKIPALAGWADR